MTGRRLNWRLAVPGTMLASLAAWAADGGESKRVLGNSLFELLDKGGAVMYVILVASVIGVAFLLENAFRTRKAAILPGKLGAQLSSHEGRSAVERIVTDGKDTAIRRILKAGHYWRHGTREEIEGAIEEAVDEELWTLKRSARPVGIIANTTPLLGLLGTVVGIIQAFDVVAQQGALGDPSALAGGISKALLTTCFGLIVAIPMLLAYHYYMGRIELLLRKCESLAKENLILPPQEEETPAAETPASPPAPEPAAEPEPEAGTTAGA